MKLLYCSLIAIALIPSFARLECASNRSTPIATRAASTAAHMVADGVLTKLGSEKLRVKDFLFIKHSLKALQLNLLGALRLGRGAGTEKNLLNQLATHELERAVYYENKGRWNPLYNFDLYNPRHICVAFIASYFSLRLAEEFIVKPLCQWVHTKATSRVKSSSHDGNELG